MAAGGGRLRYFDRVRHDSAVAEALSNLVEYRVHADLSVTLFRDFALSTNSPHKSAWFLEWARAHVERDADRLRPADFHDALDDTSLAVRHAETVRAQLPTFRPDATYWRDVFYLLGVATA